MTGELALIRRRADGTVLYLAACRARALRVGANEWSWPAGKELVEWEERAEVKGKRESGEKGNGEG